MTEENKSIQIEFAPGAFDNFEGTQEELDELIKQIQDKFANMTAEEIKAEGRELTEDDIDDLIENNPELAMKLAALFMDDDDAMPPRNLQ